jgi:hypothetical protein
MWILKTDLTYSELATLTVSLTSEQRSHLLAFMIGYYEFHKSQKDFRAILEKALAQNDLLPKQSPTENKN